jgi:hypothetical protein
VNAYLEQDKVLNYVYGGSNGYGLEIKMTDCKGRGVFATEPLKKGQLLIVEKALAEVE